MPIAAAYARVSTQRQTDSQSIEANSSVCAPMRTHSTSCPPTMSFATTATAVPACNGQHWTTCGMRRPVLSDHILVTAPDRRPQLCSSGAAGRAGTARRCRGVPRPAHEPDPHDQLLLQIRGAVAEYERVLIVERPRRGRLRKLQAGTLLPWTKPPHGYRVDPDHRAIHRRAGRRVKATVVRAIFRNWYAEDGMSLYGLGQQLELGIASPAGCPAWCPATLCHVLTNPTYIGQVFANRTRCRMATRRSALALVGRHSCGKSRREPGEWIAVAPVPALVSPIQFEKAAERLGYNRQMARRNNRAHDYLPWPRRLRPLSLRLCRAMPGATTITMSVAPRPPARHGGALSRASSPPRLSMIWSGGICASCSRRLR